MRGFWSQVVVCAVLCLASHAHSATLYAGQPGAGTVCSNASPCSLATALCAAAAGDTIILKNGRYTGGSSMLIPPAGKAGTSSLPITVQAETDGGVLIDGGKIMRPVWMGSGVAHWKLKGFNACCSNDTTIMIGSGATNIRLDRVIAWDQEDATAGVITVWQSTNTVLTDVAAWGHGRKMLAVLNDLNTIVNRGFFLKYAVSNVPNNVGMVTNWAFNSKGNRFYNTISALDLQTPPTLVSYTQADIFGPDTYQGQSSVITTMDLRGNIAYHVDGQAIGGLATVMNNGIAPATVPASNVLTIVNQNNLTMRRSATTPTQGHICPANGTTVICTQDNWTDSVGTLAGGTHTTEGAPIPASAAPDLLRLAATIQPTDGAWIKHCHREDGTLILDTSCALWPWPMNQRIKDAMVASGRQGRGVDGHANTDLTAVILGLAGSSLGPTEVLHLTYTTQPQSRTLGTPLPSITACVYNAQDVLQVGFVSPMTIALGVNPGPAILTGTLVQTPVSGCATWNNLLLDTAGTGYTLRATAPGVTSVDSNPFNITTVPPTVVGKRVRVVR